MSHTTRPRLGHTLRSLQLPARQSVVAALGLSCVLFGQACSIIHYDEDSNTTHVWGFGHLAVRATPATENVRGIVSSVESAGFALGTWQSSHFVAVGWSRQQAVEVIDDNTQFRIDAPRTNLLTVDVGSELRTGENERPLP